MMLRSLCPHCSASVIRVSPGWTCCMQGVCVGVMVGAWSGVGGSVGSAVEVDRLWFVVGVGVGIVSALWSGFLLSSAMNVIMTVVRITRAVLVVVFVCLLWLLVCVSRRSVSVWM